MKTSVTMKSQQDRNLFGVVISQDTKSRMLSITDLQEAYERARWMHGWSDRKVADVMQTKEFRERVFYLLENQGLIATNISGFMDMVESEGIVKVLKGLGVYKSTGARSTRRVLADPYIWVLIAMEMNPMIYAKVVIWLTDTLIFERVEAGTHFLPMNSAIKSIVPEPDYPKYCRLINERVFGHHQTGMRNLASAKELKAIAKIETYVKDLIDAKVIRDEDGVINIIKTINI
jgi:hypothetical protein